MTMEPQPIGEDVMGVLRDVVEQLEHDFPVRVQSFFRNPLGLGLVQFQSATQCQLLIYMSPIAFVIIR